MRTGTLKDCAFVRMGISRDRYRENDMNKTLKVIHRILFWLNPIAIVVTLVIYLMKWNSYPQEIGVHFGPDGNFDVIAAKYYGLYWQLMGGLAIGGAALVNYLVSRKNVGLKMNEKGDRLFRTVMTFTTDAVLLPVTAMFVNASRGVIIQQGIDKNVMTLFMTIVFFAFLIGLTALIVIYATHKDKAEKKDDPNRGIRLSRIAAWLIEVCAILIFFLVSERMPSDERYAFDPDYAGLAYFGNFDRYMSKWLILVPHVLLIAFLAICEVIAVKAVKKEHFAAVKLADRSKVTTALMAFWWNMNLCSEISIGIVSMTVWAGFCVLWALLYLLGRKKDSSADK